MCSLHIRGEVVKSWHCVHYTFVVKWSSPGFVFTTHPYWSGQILTLCSLHLRSEVVKSWLWFQDICVAKTSSPSFAFTKSWLRIRPTASGSRFHFLEILRDDLLHRLSKTKIHSFVLIALVKELASLLRKTEYKWNLKCNEDDPLIFTFTLTYMRAYQKLWVYFLSWS